MIYDISSLFYGNHDNNNINSFLSSPAPPPEKYETQNVTGV